MIVGIIICSIILVLVIAFAILYNSFVKCRNSVQEAFSTMDVYLKKRWDLVPNLVEIVKGYSKHETDTLKEIVNLRNSTYDNISVNDKIDINNKMSQGINKIFALAENYPELKANENYINLSIELSAIEKDIANARKYYNGTVKKMNNMVQMFPSNIVAKICKFQTYKMFEIADEEKENKQVKF